MEGGFIPELPCAGELPTKANIHSGRTEEQEIHCNLMSHGQFGVFVYHGPASHSQWSDLITLLVYDPESWLLLSVLRHIFLLTCRVSVVTAALLTQELTPLRASA